MTLSSTVVHARYRVLLILLLSSTSPNALFTYSAYHFSSIIQHPFPLQGNPSRTRLNGCQGPFWILPTSVLLDGPCFYNLRVADYLPLSPLLRTAAHSLLSSLFLASWPPSYPLLNTLQTLLHMLFATAFQTEKCSSSSFGKKRTRSIIRFKNVAHY